jgi:hypothetical protein
MMLKKKKRSKQRVRSMLRCQRKGSWHPPKNRKAPHHHKQSVRLQQQHQLSARCPQQHLLLPDLLPRVARQWQQTVLVLVCVRQQECLWVREMLLGRQRLEWAGGEAGRCQLLLAVQHKQQLQGVRGRRMVEVGVGLQGGGLVSGTSLLSGQGPKMRRG